MNEKMKDAADSYLVEIYRKRLYVVWRDSRPIWTWCAPIILETGKRKISVEQRVCYKLKGEVIEGQCCLCPSSDAPFFMHKYGMWNESLCFKMQWQVATNKRYRDEISIKIAEMLESGAVDRKLFDLAICYKHYRKVEAFKEYHLMKAKKRNRRMQKWEKKWLQ